MKTRSAIRIVVSLAFGVFLAGALSSPVFAANYPISITTTGFLPATLNAQVGDTLEFRNLTTSTQSARTSVAAGFNTGDIGTQQSKTVVLNNPGTFSYYSQYNTNLTGSVTVASDSATASATPTPVATASTLTSQPVQTQSQPVSGAFEVFLAVMATGTAFLGLGWYSQKRLATDPTNSPEVINLPSIRITVEQTDEDSNA